MTPARSLTSLFATLLLACPAAAAQIDYSFNWHTPNNGFLGGLGFATGPGLFGALSGDGHFATTGDSIRICYGIDDTQGGRNEAGFSTVTWLRLVGSYPASNTVAGVDFGLTSLSSASVDSLDGDACFSPLFTQGIDSVTGAPIAQNSALSFAFVPGVISGVQPFPSFFFFYFQILGSTGLSTPAVLGDEPAGVGSFVDPLLTNLIFEVQGPLNFGPGADAYFLAATSEHIGLGLGLAGAGTGGVTNGNGRQGFGLSGLTADVSGAVAHHRLTALNQQTGTLEGFFEASFSGPGSTQWFGGIATRTPALWGSNDGRTGGGASDLSIGSHVSTFQWRLIDHLAGGEGNPAAVAFEPGLVENRGLALYSRTPADGMLQTPMSWDTLFGNLPGRPGSVVLGQQPTRRAGMQRIPANFDPLMAGFLVNQASFTIGETFTPSFDPNAAGIGSSLFDDGVGIGGPGQSFMSAPQPISAKPNPALIGTKLGLAAFGLQFDADEVILGITEFGNGMTLNLQP